MLELMCYVLTVWYYAAVLYVGLMVSPSSCMIGIDGISRGLMVSPRGCMLGIDGISQGSMVSASVLWFGVDGIPQGVDWIPRIWYLCTRKFTKLL